MRFHQWIIIFMGLTNHQHIYWLWMMGKGVYSVKWHHRFQQETWGVGQEKYVMGLIDRLENGGLRVFFHSLMNSSHLTQDSLSVGHHFTCCAHRSDTIAPSARLCSQHDQVLREGFRAHQERCSEESARIFLTRRCKSWMYIMMHGMVGHMAKIGDIMRHSWNQEVKWGSPWFTNRKRYHEMLRIGGIGVQRSKDWFRPMLFSKSSCLRSAWIRVALPSLGYTGEVVAPAALKIMRKSWLAMAFVWRNSEI